MTHREFLDLLADMGVWAPERSGHRDPTLRWGNSRQGVPIRGIYLNATPADLAYLALLPICKLKQDEMLWHDLPSRSILKGDEGLRNIYPRAGKEQEALRQLFELR